MKTSLTTQAGLLTASRAAGQILNALLGIVVVRHLSKEEYGTFRQIYLMAATFLQVEFGFTESLYFVLPKFPQLRAAFLRQTVFAVGALQVLTGVVLLTFRWEVANFFNNPQLSGCLDLLVLYSGFSVISRIWEVELVAERRTPYAALVACLSEGVKVALAFVAIALSAGIRPLLWALVVATAVKFLAFMVFLMRDCDFFAGAGPFRTARPQVGYALSLWIPGFLSGVIGTQAHQYIVGHYFVPSQYALYAVACFQVPFVAILSTSMSEVFLVRMTEYCAQGCDSEIFRLWNAASRKALLVLAGIVAMLVVLARPIIVVLFTVQYRESAPLFAIMVLTFIFNGVFQDALLRAFSAMKAYAAFNVLRAGLGLVLGLLGVKFWGLKGAAVSIVFSLAIVNILQLVPCAKLMQVPLKEVLPWKDLAKIALVALVAAIATRTCLYVCPSEGIKLVLGIPLFALIYGGLSIASGLLSADEVRTVIKDVRSLRQGVQMSETDMVTASQDRH